MFFSAWTFPQVCSFCAACFWADEGNEDALAVVESENVRSESLHRKDERNENALAVVENVLRISQWQRGSTAAAFVPPARLTALGAVVGIVDLLDRHVLRPILQILLHQLLT